MFTHGKRYFTNGICFISIFCSTCLYGHHEYYPSYEWLDYSDLDESEGNDPIENYDNYGEFGGMLREFDRQIDDYDRSIESGFFLFKWGKKLTNWIKKTARQMCLKMLGLQKIKQSKNNAYTITRFKRVIDGICDTGPLNELIDGIGVTFRCSWPQSIFSSD